MDETLKTVKANQGRIEQLLDTWSNTGLFARYQRSANLSDFDKLQRGLRAQRYEDVQEGERGVMMCVGVFYHYKYLLQYSYLIADVIS